MADEEEEEEAVVGVVEEVEEERGARLARMSVVEGSIMSVVNVSMAVAVGVAGT